MKLIFGLGNPGEKYDTHRHNVGFMVNKNLISKFNITTSQQKHHSIIYTANIKEEKIVIAYPQTFMNLSGKAVLSLMSFYKLPVENILVIYDDFDIPFGQFRLRKNGNPGTHNGMKSVVQSIGKNFPRLRIGIGPAPEQQSITSFVLNAFNASEQEVLPQFLKEATKITEKWLTEPFEIAQQYANTTHDYNRPQIE